MVTKCACGRVVRGSEFKKHVSNYTNTADADKHSSVKRVTCCVNCGEFLRTRDNFASFRDRHMNCPTGKVNSPTFLRLFNDFNPDNVDLDLEEEVIAAAKNIANIRTDDEPIPLSEESEESEEEEIVVNSAYAERVKELFGHISEDEEKPPKTSTPKKGIAAQLSNEEEEKVRVSREEAFKQLKRRYAALSSNNKDLIAKNEGLHQKVRRITEVSNELEKVRCDLKQSQKVATEMEEKVKNTEKVEEELRRKTEKLADMERRMGEMSDYHDMKRKAGRLAELEKELRRKRIDIHIPVYNNVMCDTPTFQEDLNTTVECYHNPQLGVNCLHMGVEMVGILKSIHVSKAKTKIPSKLLS